MPSLFSKELTCIKFQPQIDEVTSIIVGKIHLRNPPEKLFLENSVNVWKKNNKK